VSPERQVVSISSDNTIFQILSELLYKHYFLGYHPGKDAGDSLVLEVFMVLIQDRNAVYPVPSKVITERDQRKMITFISRMLPEGYGRVTLADEITAEVTVCGDYLEIESNCPEWVDVRQIYDHLRWDGMPGWEQAEWIRSVAAIAVPTPISRLENIADRFEHVFSRLSFEPEAAKYAGDNVNADQAPFRFQWDGVNWIIHFKANGVVKRKPLRKDRGLQHYAQLLAKPHHDIQSVELAGHNNSETLALIKSEMQFSDIHRHDAKAIQDYKRVLGLFKEQRESARRNGDVMEMEEVDSQIKKLEGELWPGGFKGEQSKFTTLKRQTLGKSKTAQRIHKTVSKAMGRAIELLIENEMGEVARFLEMSVNGEGYAYAYRPSDPEPEWLL
jgi:hypothetical protein